MPNIWKKNCFDVIIFVHTTSKAVEYFFCGAVVVIGGTTIHKIMQLTWQVFMYREVREFPCKKLDT